MQIFHELRTNLAVSEIRCQRPVSQKRNLTAQKVSRTFAQEIIRLFLHVHLYKKVNSLALFNLLISRAA